MIKYFLLILMLIFLSTKSYSQWWTSGGNLIWPYGKVSITKSPLEVDTVASVNGNLTLTDQGRNSAVSLSQTHINVNTDSTIYTGDIFLSPTSDIWLTNSSGEFHINDYDWAPILTYSMGKLQFYHKYGFGTYWVLDDNTSTSTFHGSNYLFDCVDFRIISPEPGWSSFVFNEGDSPGESSIYMDADTLTLHSDKIKLPTIPSDSSGLQTGMLYFDSSTGTIKRKF